MKRNSIPVILLVTTLSLFGLVGGSFAQMQMQSGSQTCETCTMTVGADALDHLKVTDGNGTRHYVECIGCALKLLKTYDSIHIETYCDWYGPDYKIIAEISQHGALTTVDPATVLLLVGGGCTGNRVAYNETAADALLAKGFSENTMMMMQQPLPANTNVTTIPVKAMTFATNNAADAAQLSPFVVIVLFIVAVAVITGAIVGYKKLKH